MDENWMAPQQSPAILQENLHILEVCHPSLADAVKAYIRQHQITIQQDNNGIWFCDLQEPGSLQIHRITYHPQTASTLTARYQGYRPAEQWLILFGADAIAPAEITKDRLPDASPVFLLEPSLINFIFIGSIFPLESFFTRRQVRIYAGEDAVNRFLQDCREKWLHLWISFNSVSFIPGQYWLNEKDCFQQNFQSLQKTMKECQNHVMNTHESFRRKYRPYTPSGGKKIMVLIPAVSCWVNLSQGFAEGFRQSGYEIREFQFPFPFSQITPEDRFRFIWEVWKFQPDFFFLISHSSDLLAVGLESLPIPRLIWYADHPDHLSPYPHNPHDKVFAVWDEFSTALLQRNNLGGRFIGEIQSGAAPLQFHFRNELACEVGFVGSVAGNTTIRREIGKDILSLIDQMVLAKLADHKKTWETLFTEYSLGESELAHIIAVLDRSLRREGMNDKQVATLFLHTECIRERRVKILSALHGFDIKIFGNDDWNGLLQGTPLANAFQRRGLTSGECLDFYHSAQLSLSIHPIYPHNGPTTRDFDIPLCDGFVLTDLQRYVKEDIEKFFIPHQEIALFEDENDIAHQVRYYIDHPDERKEITQAAKTRILRDHHFSHRVREMMQKVDPYLLTG